MLHSPTFKLRECHGVFHGDSRTSIFNRVAVLERPQPSRVAQCADAKAGLRRGRSHFTLLSFLAAKGFDVHYIAAFGKRWNV